MTLVRHAHITVNLTHLNGNNFLIMGVVTAALRQAGLPSREIDNFTAEAVSKGLMATTRAWVRVRDDR